VNDGSSAGSTVYSGQILKVTNQSVVELVCSEMVQNFVADASSSAANTTTYAAVSNTSEPIPTGGAIFNVLNCPVFNTMSQSYMEYRVVGIDLEWCPSLENTDNTSYTVGGGTYNSSFAVATVHGPSDNITTQQIGSLETCKMHALNRRFSRQIRANGPEEMLWTATGSVNTGNFMILVSVYTDEPSPSKEFIYGTFLVKFRVQFRGLF